MTESTETPRDPRYNALRHGLSARRLLLREEEAAEFAAFRDDLFREWCPRGQSECGAVYEMAEAQWRLMRCAPIEAELLESMRHPDVEMGGLAAAFLGGRDADGSALLRLARYRRTIERSYDRALRDLLLLHRGRNVWSRPEVPLPGGREPQDWVEVVHPRWRAEAAPAEAMPPLPEDEDPTVTVESFVIGEDGEQIPMAEYERREQAGRHAPAAPEDAESPASPAAAPAPGAPPGDRTKADILQNGARLPDDDPAFEGAQPAPPGRPRDPNRR